MLNVIRATFKQNEKERAPVAVAQAVNVKAVPAAEVQKIAGSRSSSAARGRGVNREKKKTD